MLILNLIKSNKYLIHKQIFISIFFFWILQWVHSILLKWNDAVSLYVILPLKTYNIKTIDCCHTLYKMTIISRHVFEKNKNAMRLIVFMCKHYVKTVTNVILFIIFLVPWVWHFFLFEIITLMLLVYSNKINIFSQFK